MNQKIVVANWKMNPPTFKEAEELFDFYSSLAGSNNGNLIICPPFIYLEPLSKIPSSLKLGAQNCHWEEKGAFTGEISPVMLKNIGVKYVIIGHSERRWIMNEDDEIINKKIKVVLRNEMVPILAVGEREKGDNREQVLINQLSGDLKDFKKEEIEKIIFAYEPVWAIGTGDAETPEHTLEAFNIIRSFLNLHFAISTSRLLYGGSVDSRNVAEFLSPPAGGPEIDGVLVGGASVNKEEFGKIIEIVS